MNEEVLPCCYCGGQPTLLRPELPKGFTKLGTTWEKSAKLVCLNLGCPGNRNMHFTFGYVRLWNQRQKAYGRTIERAKSVVPELVAYAP